jgi:hypothetical protein
LFPEKITNILVHSGIWILRGNIDGAF